MTAIQDPDAPLLADLMPWSVAPLRAGRAWVLAPDAASLRARWAALAAAPDEAARTALFRPTRARDPRSAVAQLPGQATPTGRLARGPGPCPEPVRVAHGPYDRQWLLPDHRLLDAARPELWRVTGTADATGTGDGTGQIHLLEPAPGTDGPAFSALLPDGHSPGGRPGRIRPLHRRPGGTEPNLAPGLLSHLSARLGRAVSAEDFLAWTATAATPTRAGLTVPLTASPERWGAGVARGRRALWLHTYGARCAPTPGERPRMPGGRRPYVRAALPTAGLPGRLSYEPAEETLCLGDGRIAPVPEAAWEARAGGVRVLEDWFTARTTGPAEPGTLEALRPSAWQREWTSELLELITVLSLLAELRAEAPEPPEGPRVGAAELARAGVLPPPPSSRRPASVLDHQEEGPEGQFALL
ncbi:DNA methyltransferase [Streptomyces sp. HU2014]|uniref:type ISP restriction/modification enzyme n=1 Tax=Streptomyces sp. HU2014 TaxID=2939414 RepID=UPI00200E56B5|nr:type ISP restriction/modification enzyme [Streptomyces sp. HU2014]UQI44364.1 DNA methyltransferase [Streptomyces sp. HU2014]